MPTESLLGRPGIDTPLLSRREPSTRGLQLRMCIAKRLPLSWLPISRLSTTRMCLSFRQNRTLPPLLSEQVGEAEQAEQAEQQSRASRREREREQGRAATGRTVASCRRDGDADSEAQEGLIEQERRLIDIGRKAIRPHVTVDTIRIRQDSRLDPQEDGRPQPPNAPVHIRA